MPLVATSDIKRPKDDKKLTKKQAEEWMKCALDIEYFMSQYMYIQQPGKGRVLFEPRCYQSDMMNLIFEESFTIFNAPRQCGKSTTLAAVILWYCIFTKDYKVGISAHKLDGAKEIVSRVKFAYENLPTWLKPPVIDYNKFSLTFDNGSLIEAGATTEDGFRGKSFDLIYLDEFAHIKPAIADDFWSSLLPTISSNTSGNLKVIITSTPSGTEGLYASLWFGATMGENGFKSYQVDHNKIEGRGEKFKQDMLKKMTLNKYLQEFEGAFLSSKATLVNSMTLESVKTMKTPYTTYKDLNVFVDPNGRKLGIGIDVGTGVGGDFHAIEVFDVEKMEQVAEWRNNTMSQTIFVKEIKLFLEWLFEQGADEIYWTVESNSYGIGVTNLIFNSEEEVFQKANFITEHKNKTPGMLTTTKTKMQGTMLLKDLMETYRMSIHSKMLLSELKFFIKRGQSFAAETGMTDDLVMATVVLCNMIRELAYYEDDVYDRINDLELSTSDGGDDDDFSAIVF